VLETEISFLDSHWEELLQQYGGKFLVIKGQQLTGAFDTIEEALSGLGGKHGLSSVSIGRPSDVRVEVSIPALRLGILNADYTRPATGSK
jgi:hypothetical protein